jgi:hypothetical protein
VHRFCSYHFVGISTTFCPFVDASHNFNSSLLLHLRIFLIGHLLPMVVLLFRNFRPGMGEALSGINMKSVCLIC